MPKFAACWVFDMRAGELRLYGDLGASVMKHIDSAPELVDKPLVLDTGTYWGRKARLMAVFSCISRKGYGRNVATVTAVETPDGIQLRHSLELDKPR